MYKRIGLIAIGATLALSLTGCGKEMNYSKKDVNRHMNGVTSQSTRHPGDVIGQNANRGDVMGQNANRNDGTLNAKDTNKQHEMMLKHVRKVNGVNDATVFVNGNDIVVGLDLDNNAKRAEVEQNVTKALQEANAGYTVHVTSDASMHDRIRQIKGQMVPMDGHPIRNMAEDITVLLEDMGRMVTEPLR